MDKGGKHLKQAFKGVYKLQMYCFNNLETSDMSQKIKSTHLHKKIFHLET